jgi:hypothetical protein
VRVLVQDKATRKFLCGSRDWTGHEPEATDFQKTVRAIEHCLRERIFDAQLVLTFEEDRKLDIILPIRLSMVKSSGFFPRRSLRASG